MEGLSSYTKIFSAVVIEYTLLSFLEYFYVERPSALFPGKTEHNPFVLARNIILAINVLYTGIITTSFACKERGCDACWMTTKVIFFGFLFFTPVIIRILSQFGYDFNPLPLSVTEETGCLRFMISSIGEDVGHVFRGEHSSNYMIAKDWIMMFTSLGGPTMVLGLIFLQCCRN